MITILLLVNVSIVKLPAFVVVIPNIDEGCVDIGVNIGNIVTFNADDVDIFYIDIYIGIVMYMLPLTGTLF